MISSSANRALLRNIKRLSENVQGHARAALGMGGTTDVLLSTANIMRLPVAENSDIHALQNADGQLKFLSGYSQAGGPDVS